MNAQATFFVSGPEFVSGNFFSTNTGDLGSFNQPFGNAYLTGTGYMDKLSTRSVEATTGQITGLSVSSLYLTGTGYLNRTETQNSYCDSGVFNYLNPTGRFFPPLLTFEQRTGLYSGLGSPSGTPYDGLMVYQITSGQKLMIVQSGMWKTATLT